jgi:hypothetical protein
LGIRKDWVNLLQEVWGGERIELIYCRRKDLGRRKYWSWWKRWELLWCLEVVWRGERIGLIYCRRSGEEKGLG